jgi:hypothetical protein
LYFSADGPRSGPMLHFQVSPAARGTLMPPDAGPFCTAESSDAFSIKNSLFQIF